MPLGDEQLECHWSFQQSRTLRHTLSNVATLQLLSRTVVGPMQTLRRPETVAANSTSQPAQQKAQGAHLCISRHPCPKQRHYFPARKPATSLLHPCCAWHPLCSPRQAPRTGGTPISHANDNIPVHHEGCQEHAHAAVDTIPAAPQTSSNRLCCRHPF